MMIWRYGEVLSINFYFFLRFIIIFQTNTKKKEEPKFSLSKPNVISVMPMKGTETTEKPEKTNQMAVVARVFAWYINPVIYVVFSVLYFIIGLYY